jgi:8-oxo-dGTP diphosphatase
MTDEIDVAKILLQNSEDQFLVVKKVESYDEMGGKWELPGGKMENGEDREESVRREMIEETELKVENLRDVVRVEVEAKNCVNCYIMYSKNFSGEVELSKEHSEYRWVTSEEFRNMDWHSDAGYGVPAMVYLRKYLD